MAVTGHFIDEHMQRKTVLIDCSIFDERHSAKNIAENIIHICQPYFPMEKVSLIVTDNAKNMINAVDSELKLKHLGCIAHSLNLAVTNSLNEVNDLLTKIRDIVIVYRRSNIAAKNLRKYLCSSEERKDLKVILDVKTRWNSTFYMVKRFLELKDAIRSTMGLMNDPPEALDVPEWESVQHLCDVLKPFEKVTCELSSEKYLSASMAPVLIGGLQKICENLLSKSVNEQVQNVVLVLQRELGNRFTTIDSREDIAQAAFLDPRIKKLGLKCDVAKKIESDIICELSVVAQTTHNLVEDDEEID
ncbi:zinc finger BED domain-containing protein 4-like [Stegodyphus dumicola]|uniref:zinc finger BED domain-containing protein 4-like n=1 Tax=Stegodyphus dumicola TaxID=202533 RepID=UPI0015A926AA|nr:zinc finger BED domain-containing protein 4-like [Stegodyphus dumicola]